jgi:hypothetical protein
MLEAIVIIIALGGLEIALWMADHKRQAEQLATLEAIWVELALLNEERSSERSEPPLRQPELIVMPEPPRAVAQ